VYGVISDIERNGFPARSEKGQRNEENRRSLPFGSCFPAVPKLRGIQAQLN